MGQTIIIKFMSKSKFLRIRNSENLSQLPSKIFKDLNKDQFVYFDFADDNHLRLLQKANPQDSEEETSVIGADHIAGVNQLSKDTYNMFQYLSENRILNERKRNIDEVVRNRIRKIQSKRKRKQQGKVERKNLKNYSIEGREPLNSSDLGMDPDKLEDYLEEYNHRKVLERLKAGERQLQKSISSAGYYKKNVQSESLDFKINNLPIRLPSINKIRYDKSKI